MGYDLNFRSKLWSSEQAIATTKEIVPHLDVLIGNEEDFQKVLGFEVEGTNANLSELPVDAYKRMVERVVKTYPNIKAVCTTLREVKSGLINHWGGILWVTPGNSTRPDNSKIWRSKTASAVAMDFRAASRMVFSTA